MEKVNFRGLPPPPADWQALMVKLSQAPTYSRPRSSLIGRKETDTSVGLCPSTVFVIDISLDEACLSGLKFINSRTHVHVLGQDQRYSFMQGRAAVPFMMSDCAASAWLFQL